MTWCLIPVFDGGQHFTVERSEQAARFACIQLVAGDEIGFQITSPGTQCVKTENSACSGQRMDNFHDLNATFTWLQYPSVVGSFHENVDVGTAPVKEAQFQIM